jgi:uncharacterized membrane protein
MKIAVTEHQKKFIITESISEEFNSIIERGYNFTKEILEKSAEQIGINIQFAITWGASIGGMVGPLNDFIKNTESEMSDIEISLLLTGIIASYYVDNKEYVKKILTKIKEKGLSEVFLRVFKKSQELKNAFFDFIESLNITLHKVTNIMSYTFIIPIIPMLYDMATGSNLDGEQISEIAKRLASFGVLTVSGILVRELINKIIKRFKS